MDADLRDRLLSAARELIAASDDGSVDGEDVARSLHCDVEDPSVYSAFREIERRGDLRLEGWGGAMGLPYDVRVPDDDRTEAAARPGHGVAYNLAGPIRYIRSDRNRVGDRVLVGVMITVVGGLILAAIALSIGLGTSGEGSANGLSAAATPIRAGGSAPASRAPAHSASASRGARTTESSARGSSKVTLRSYRGARFSANVPAGWRIEENEASRSGSVESTWHDPANTRDSLLIDASPATDRTLQEDAAPVQQELLGEPGYQELYYGPGDLGGVESWMWVWRIGTYQRIDYFFDRCSTDFAALGSSSPGRFDHLRSMFRSVAQSVRAKCHKEAS